MDWSFDLLSNEERIPLRRLSIFAGGWAPEAAEVICSGDGVEASEILNLLTRLVDKSLVIAETQGGEARYRLLETVRQHARERLTESGESTNAATRHRDWYLMFAEQADAKRGGPDKETSLGWLEAEHDCRWTPRLGSGGL